MDSLRPDRDDLDQYNRRKNNKNKATPVAAKSKAAGAGVTSANVAANKVSTNKETPAVASKGSGALVFVTLCMLVVCGVLAFGLWQQTQELEALKSRLENTDDFMGQSKLLMARLEGEVSETGAELAETGTEAEKKLAFLESEIRKLWGVAYDRNRKSLKKHSDQLDQLEKKIGSVDGDRKSLGKKVSGIEASMKNADKRLAERINTMSGEVSITRAEQEENINSIKEQLDSLAARDSADAMSVKAIELSVKENSEKLKNNSSVLASVDDSRRQLVKRIVNLESRLDALSSSIKGNAQR